MKSTIITTVRFLAKETHYLKNKFSTRRTTPAATAQNLVTALLLLFVASAYSFNSAVGILQASASDSASPLVIGIDNRFISFFVIAVVIAVVIIATQRKKDRKKKAKTATASREAEPTVVRTTRATVKPEINSELEAAVLERLKAFEGNHEYLAKDISLSTMAALLDTNSKYAAAIILKNRGKNFTDYLNDLKIKYVVAQLTTDSKYRRYSRKALCEEAGFGAVKTFTRAFKTNCGRGFTEFIDELTTIAFIPDQPNTAKNEQQS